MSLYEIYFSPTGGTKKVADILANSWSSDFTTVDLIKNPRKITELNLCSDDICIVAVPSYGGRVPGVALDNLKNIKANNAKAVLVAVYGNRHIDDTLMELSDTLTECNFSCIAGIEAVAEHSLLHSFGAGRPDSNDENNLKGFVLRIKEAMENNKLSDSPELPGSHDYRDYNGVPIKPITTNKCTNCGLCVTECPVNAISKENPKVVDKNLCISCMHCMSVCPVDAIKTSKLLTFVASTKMKKTCSDRKENRLYL